MRLASKALSVAYSLAAVISVLGATRQALAAGMDPTPERLVLQPPGLPKGATCQGIAMNPEQVLHPPFQPGALPNQFTCAPDNIAWRNMMSELGMAIAPTAFHPARTTGIGGFALTLEMAFTHINADTFSTATDGSRVQYWHQGTQGAVDPNTKQYSIVNNSPDSLLQVYSLKARKGLPFGFELAGSLGYLSNTSLWVGGADIRWSLLEGFRTGALGYLPDISVGGGVRTLGGSEKFFLTTVGIDVQVSKPFAIADMATLTPYVGYQRVIIFADSSIVNSAPNVDPLKQCGYEGNQVAGNPYADPNKPMDGSPVCRNKLSNGADNNSAFNNNITFQNARIHRHRGIVGLNYRYEILYLAAQFMFDLTDPSAENPDIFGGRQWTTVFEGGVFF